MIRTTIGTYRVVHLLGQGGMGTVYQAEHVLLGRRVALKVLLPAYSMDEAIVRRFFNEARAVASISDPGIVQIFDFGFHTDGSAFLVMELLEGEPLDARLRRHGRLSPLDAVRLIRQGADSLAAAHARGIIHRDLKPENLFAVGDPAVTGGERLKILDFGVAKLIGDDFAMSKTRTGLLIGTPIYMSPEQCRGTGEIDVRSDVYSLGCVLFALLTGRPPFVHDSSGDLLASHLREAPPSVTELVPAVPRELDDVVQRCLAKLPGDRYPSMQAFGHALDLAAARSLLGGPSRSAPHATPVPSALRAAVGSSRSAPRATPVPGAAAITPLHAAGGESIAASVFAPARRRRRRLIGATAATIIALGALGAAAALRAWPDRRAVAAGSAVDATSPTSVPLRGGPAPASAPIDEVGAPGVSRRRDVDPVVDAGAEGGVAADTAPDGETPPALDPAIPQATHAVDASPPAHHRSRPRPRRDDGQPIPAVAPEMLDRE